MNLILDDQHIYHLEGRTLDGLTSTIKESGLIRNSDPWYADRGMKVHLATEFYDKGTLDESIIDPQIQGYLSSWKQFRKDQNYTPSHIECLIYHPHLMVGTKIDRLPGPLDIKGGVPEPWHILQLGFQWACLHENQMSDLVRMPQDVYLDPDGGAPKVKIYKLSEMREAFKVYASMLVFIRWKREKRIK